MNIPNKLTITRVLLVPLFMIFLLSRENYAVYAEIFALVTFVLAAITDGLDGYLARRNKVVTKFGKILDPLADKLLISAALISFVALKEISAWVAIIIIGRELAVTGLRVIAASEGIVISASKWGKWKTNIQIIAVIAVIVIPDIIKLPKYVPLFLVWVAVIITIISGVEYYRKVDIDFFKEETD